MIRYDCDSCEKEMQSLRATATTSLEFDGYKVTPGYVGTKMLCTNCYANYIHVIRTFFKDYK
jgi:hypothetical protein